MIPSVDYSRKKSFKPPWWFFAGWGILVAVKFAVQLAYQPEIIEGWKKYYELSIAPLFR
mgnify:CR=1 FL=1